MPFFRKISINIYIFFLNLFLFNSILEIPLQPLKVKGIPKYGNLSIFELGNEILLKDKIILIEEGNSIISDDNLFLANVKIGSNSQSFNLLLDTGSHIFWVAKNGCLGTHSTITNFFNPSSSTTCKSTSQKFEIKYGTGKCSGLYYNDNVEYIKNKKLNINFGIASTADFEFAGADGIIGLSKSSKDESLSFIHMLKKSGNTDSLAFSIKFENDQFTSNVQGKMYIGRHEDFSKKGVQSCPLIFYKLDTFWACQLDSLRLKSKYNVTKVSYSTSVIFDTGTNFFYLPKRYIEEMNDELKKFGCSANLESKRPIILCKASGDYPDFQFEFNGNIYTIPKEYVFKPIPGYTQYVSARIIFDDSSTAIIGSLFFFLFHTLFDEESKELKFYPLKSEIIEINEKNDKNGKNEIIEEGEGGLSTLNIILISASAGVLVVIILIIVIICLIKKRKPKSYINPIGQDNKEPLYPNEE